jgi:Arc/MetJ-type ribon-helix-helix transcriptional regulator
MAPVRRSGPEDEKITINLGTVDLGHIDLLVREGVYSSRSDFIRNAIRSQLSTHNKLVDDIIVRKEFTVGFLYHSRSDLERRRKKGEKLTVKVVGMYKLGSDVSRSLAADVLEDVTVLGSLRGPKEVVAWLRNKQEVDS